MLLAFSSVSSVDVKPELNFNKRLQSIIYENKVNIRKLDVILKQLDDLKILITSKSFKQKTKVEKNQIVRDLKDLQREIVNMQTLQYKMSDIDIKQIKIAKKCPLCKKYH